MTAFPGNRPYRQRYFGPDRPSNAGTGGYDGPTRERVQQVADWLDGQAVIAAAEAILTGRRPTRCDPGE